MFDFYKRTAIGDVTTYVRPYQTISLGLMGQPNTLQISEELVTILPDASITHVPTGQADLSAVIIDPSQSFNLVDPTTGDVSGSMTFAQLKVQLFSLYIYLAAIRDAG